MAEMDNVEARIAKALKMLESPWYEQRWVSIVVGVAIVVVLVGFFWWILNSPLLTL